MCLKSLLFMVLWACLSSSLWRQGPQYSRKMLMISSAIPAIFYSLDITKGDFVDAFSFIGLFILADQYKKIYNLIISVILVKMHWRALPCILQHLLLWKFPSKGLTIWSELILCLCTSPFHLYSDYLSVLTVWISKIQMWYVLWVSTANYCWNLVCLVGLLVK